ncbi:hypothetical protein BV22DRAFT_1041271 [Leucogyrophana mollusca]|uniref:Uncharacterized protein n=1 Tax=Leucogyrophana mollusca TaxID=85980 RepID=A0ACB8B0F0_9AGAM|nr:hypothetical protein BV22DRAFT_1041271 [Leucogyrophana mollusca]
MHNIVRCTHCGCDFGDVFVCTASLNCISQAAARQHVNNRNRVSCGKSRDVWTLERQPGHYEINTAILQENIFSVAYCTHPTPLPVPAIETTFPPASSWKRPNANFIPDPRLYPTVPLSSAHRKRTRNRIRSLVMSGVKLRTPLRQRLLAAFPIPRAPCPVWSDARLHCKFGEALRREEERFLQYFDKAHRHRATRTFTTSLEVRHPVHMHVNARRIPSSGQELGTSFSLYSEMRDSGRRGEARPRVTGGMYRG